MVKNKYRKPHKFKRKKPFYKKKNFWVFSLVGLIGIEIIFLVCFCPFFKLREIKVRGSQNISEQKVNYFAWDKIERKLLFWKSKSILLAGTSNLKKELVENHPYISEIEIKRKFPDILNINLKERKPNFIWCVSNKCFKTDKEGIIFERVQKSRDLPIIIDQTKEKIPSLGKKVIEKEKVENIFKIKKEIKNYNIKITSFVIKKDRLTVNTKDGWEIYFDLEKDIEWQITKLKADLEREIPEDKRKDLEYIELRFGNFAPYKFK